MEKGNVLMVMPWLPYPLVSGGHQALYNGIEAIYDDWNVSLAFVVEDEYQYIDAVEGFRKELPDVKLYPYYQCKRIADGAKRKKEKKNKWPLPSFFHKKKKQRNYIEEKIGFWKYCVLPPSAEWINHLREIFKIENFDIVQVEMPWFLSSVFGLPENVRKLYVHHEIGMVRRELELRKIPKDEYYPWAFKKFADINEVAQLNLYDGIVTLSSEDANKLCSAGVQKPIYSSFAVIKSKPLSYIETVKDKRLTFVGPESHTPNFEGITWFLDMCWKKLKSMDSEYTLDIIGEWSQEKKDEYILRYPDVRFLGFVDDLASTLKNSVMIVPINIGSGIRMKILEGASIGIPFVSTTVGAEGIPVKDGVHCFIADDPDTFVDDILKLQSPELQRKLVKAANDMVNECYSMSALRANRLGIYRTVTNIGVHED